jgi:glucosylceramidase
MNRIYQWSVLILATINAWACEDHNKNNTQELETGDVTVYVTTNTRSQDFNKQAVNFSNEPVSAAATITLNPNQRYQTMDGFGAAVTGSSSYNLLKMTQTNRTKFLKETFSQTEGMGYSYIRIAIGCSDFSLSEYTCWDNRAAGFALTSEETDYVIPVLKEILAINPDVKILASPWTCPIWMKNTDNDGDPWNGGTLKTEFYADYAGYFVKWIQAFEQNGIKIYSITPQNEPLHGGNSASLYMTSGEERNFVNNNLVPALKAAGLKTKVYIWDHNYDNPYPAEIYAAGGLDAEYVKGAAFHDYAGNQNTMTTLHNQYPNYELIFTESSIGSWNDGRNLSETLVRDMAYLGLGNVNNWCRAVIVWNLMLDENGAPNRPKGCTTCYGAVDILSTNWTSIRRNSHYYVIGHLASVVKPGAIRIGTTGYTETGITYTAFENTDGAYALVLVNNTGESKKVTVNDGVKHFVHTVPAKVVVSYWWGK